MHTTHHAAGANASRARPGELFTSVRILRLDGDPAGESLRLEGEALSAETTENVAFTIEITRYDAAVALDRSALPVDSAPGEAEGELEDKLAALTAILRSGCLGAAEKRRPAAPQGEQP